MFVVFLQGSVRQHEHCQMSIESKRVVNCFKQTYAVTIFADLNDASACMHSYIDCVLALLGCQVVTLSLPICSWPWSVLFSYVASYSPAVTRTARA